MNHQDLSLSFGINLESKNKKTGANTVYKPWLVLAHLENPADFPLASIGLECSVTNPRHSPYTKRCSTFKKTQWQHINF